MGVWGAVGGEEIHFVTSIFEILSAKQSSVRNRNKIKPLLSEPTPTTLNPTIRHLHAR